MIKAKVEIDKGGQNRVCKIRKTSFVNSFNKRVVNRNGDENYPGQTKSAADVVEAEDKIGHGADDCIGHLQPEFQLIFRLIYLYLKMPVVSDNNSFVAIVLVVFILVLM